MRVSFLDAYKNCHQILEESLAEGKGPLFLGDYSAALDVKALRSKGVKTVLTVAAGLQVSYPSGIFHKSYPALDQVGYNISKFFDDTYTQIEEGILK